MANQVVNRQVNIFIESGQAQKALDLLVKKENDLKAALEKATDPKKVQQLKTEIDRLQEPIERARKKVSGELAPSFNDVKKSVNDLGNRLKRMSEEDADFTTVLHQYHEGNQLLQQQQEKVGILHHAMRSFWQEAKMIASGIVIGNIANSLLTGVLDQITGWVTGAAKLSDQLSDIQRVTGMTTEEVKKLNTELKKIDTRTSNEDLRAMAITAGKLGVAKNDILEFVAATDKLKVALGDELGDVDQITTQLGKILNVFDGKITAENLTHLGNAFVDLANKGVATGGFMADFTQRVSGIAKASNLSLGAVLGLAAGIEETGGEAESGSTAIQKLLIKIAEDLPKAAKIAGAKTKEEVQAFTDLFAKAPQEALLQYAAGLQKNSSSFAELTKEFKDAGQDGARVIQTLTKLGSSTDLFRQKINDATIALQGNNQIEDAFKLKNENLAGSLDRLAKNFKAVFTTPVFQDGAKAAINVLSALVSVLKASIQFLSDHKILIGSLGVIYAAATIQIKSLSLATIFSNTVTAISNGVSRAAAAAMTIYRIVLVTLTRQITFATGAQMAWNTITSLGAGPLGILLVAVGAVVIGIEKMVNRTKELTLQQKLAGEIAERVANATSDQVTEIKLLEGILKDENAQYAEKEKALRKLIEINPEFAKTLKLNKDGTVEGTQAIEDYIKALTRQAEAQAKFELFNEKIKQRSALINKLRAQTPGSESISDDQIIEQARKAQGVVKALDLKGDIATVVSLTGEIDQLSTGLKQLRESALNAGNNGNKPLAASDGILEGLRKKLKELQDAREKASNVGDTKDEKGALIPGINTLNKQIKDTEAAIAKLEGQTTKLGGSGKKAAHDLKSLEEELRQIATSLLPDDTATEKFQKELQALDDKYAKLRDKANGNNKLLLQIDQLYQLEKKKLTDKFVSDQEKNLNEALQNEIDRNKKMEEALNQRFKPLLDKALQKLQSESNARDQDIILRDQLAIVEKTGRAKRDAEIKLIDDQLDIERKKKQKELDALGQDEVAKRQLILDQIKQLEDDARRNRREKEAAYWQGIIDFARQGLDMFNTFSEIKNNKENADLARDKAINDKKKANLDKRLKAGLISQEAYDREVGKLQKKQEAKEKEIRDKQFKREQKAAIAQTLISAAEGAIKLWANPGFPAAIPLAAILAIETGLKIAAISSQKPPQYGRGGFLYGKSHAEGGMGVFDHYGRKQAELEGGEGIGSKKTMTDRRVYNVTGTPSQIYSLLNGVNGGVQWSSGAVLRPGWTVQKPMPMNFAAANNSLNTVRRFYAAGGQFDANNNPVNTAGNSQELVNLMMHLVATQQQLNGTLADIKANGINANVFLNDIENQQKRKANLLKEAGNS